MLERKNASTDNPVDATRKAAFFPLNRYSERFTYREAKKDIMASNPRNLTISGVFLAFPRFFAIMRFADTECRKKDIISKKRLWTGFEQLSPAAKA